MKNRPFLFIASLTVSQFALSSAYAAPIRGGTTTAPQVPQQQTSQGGSPASGGQGQAPTPSPNNSGTGRTQSGGAVAGRYSYPVTPQVPVTNGQNVPNLSSQIATALNAGITTGLNAIVPPGTTAPPPSNMPTATQLANALNIANSAINTATNGSASTAYRSVIDQIIHTAASNYISNENIARAQAFSGAANQAYDDTRSALNSARNQTSTAISQARDGAPMVQQAASNIVNSYVNDANRAANSAAQVAGIAAGQVRQEINNAASSASRTANTAAQVAGIAAGQVRQELNNAASSANQTANTAAQVAGIAAEQARQSANQAYQAAQPTLAQIATAVSLANAAAQTPGNTSPYTSLYNTALALVVNSTAGSRNAGSTASASTPSSPLQAQIAATINQTITAAANRIVPPQTTPTQRVINATNQAIQSGLNSIVPPPPTPSQQMVNAANTAINTAADAITRVYTNNGGGEGASGGGGSNTGSGGGAFEMPRQPDGRVTYPTYQGPSEAELARRSAAAQAAARQVDPNSQTGQTITTAQVPNTDGDNNPTAADTSMTDATTGGHVEVTPYNATDGAIAGVEAMRQSAAEEAAARARQGNARNLANNVVNAAIANTRQITGGGSFQQARMASIYQGYNVGGGSGFVQGVGPSSAGTSLTAAGYSPSSAGISLTNVMRSNSAGGNVGFSYAGVGGVSSASNGFSLVTQGLSLATYGFSLAGGPFVAGNLGLDDPAMRGLGANDISNPWAFAPAPRNSDIAAATLGRNFQLQNDPNGRRGQESGGMLVANLLDDQSRNINELINNGVGGLSALLAQPFNVVMTWGADAYDLDLHMTGPSGENTNDRFHIYYAARGSQTAFPYAELIKDCICSSGSEVILTTQLIRGGVYRISAFNFGDQSTTSTNLSDMSNAEIYIVRGGVATAQGNGTTIVGGRVIYRGKVPKGRQGNTWTAVEINAKNGRIIAPNTVGNSGGSTGVQ